MSISIRELQVPEEVEKEWEWLVGEDQEEEEPEFAPVE